MKLIRIGMKHYEPSVRDPYDGRKRISIAQFNYKATDSDYSRSLYLSGPNKYGSLNFFSYAPLEIDDGDFIYNTYCSPIPIDRFKK